MNFMFFLYKNSKSLLTECLLSTAFPTSLKYQDALLASKLVAAWKNLQPWNFWQKGPRPDPCFCFFGGKVINCFSGCIHDFRKLKFIDSIAKRWETESPYPKFALQESLSFLLGVPIELTKFHGLFERPKNQPQKMKDKQPFFLIIFLAQPRNWNKWIPSIQP